MASELNNILNNLGIKNSSNPTSALNSLASQVGGANYNDIAWFASALTTMQGTDDSQKVSTITNMAQKVLSIFSDLSTNDEAKAAKDVTKNDKSIDENGKKIEETYSALNDRLQEILEKCDGNKGLIDNALKTIEELGGDKGKIKEKQEELDKQLEIIEENKAKLNDPNCEDKKSALAAILGAVGQINTLVQSVQEYQSQIEEQTQVVNNAVQEVQQDAEAMQGIIAEGVEDAQTLTQNVSEKTMETAVEQANGIQKTTLGTAQISAGTAAEANPFTAATGARLIASGTSKVGGGKDLMIGAINGFKELAQNSANINSGLENFVNFAQGIGQYSSGIVDLAGAYNSTVEPMITSIGSWEAVSEANQQLETYVAQYSLGVENKNQAENTSTNKSDNESLQGQKEYQKFDFDTSIFKQAFQNTKK